jgi:glycosyltransferase involved in cell wall biosynthesis
MEKMRILQINSVCGYGSTGRIVVDIHNELIKQGHESYIAYGRGEAAGVDKEFLIKIGTKLDIYSHVFQSRVFDNHGLASYISTKKFLKKVNELQPDIIHLHNIHGYYLNYKMIFDFFKKWNKKIIWTLHDSWSYTGHCAYYDYINCRKWEMECKKCPNLKSYPTSFGLDNSKRNFKLKKESFLGLNDLIIVTPSKWLACEVKKSFLKNYPIKVINNGIDTNIFKPAKSDFREKNDLINTFLILGVASVWEKRKGIEYFFELSKLLRDNEKIVLVGISKTQKKVLPKNIIGIERTNNINELAEIYSEADLFFNPTLEDNYPTTNLESLACGTPVVTFKTGGSSEPIKNGKNGLVIPKGSLEELMILLRNKKRLEFEKEELSKRKEYGKEEKYMYYIQLYKHKNYKNN